jgi:hypothetical protein
VGREQRKFQAGTTLKFEGEQAGWKVAAQCAGRWRKFEESQQVDTETL